ncbi:MAG: sensor histidine kinase [Planctomycetota bacterium]
MLTLVFPSVLLSAFALQAVEAQRRATLAERQSRLQDAARERVTLLHADFLGPAQAAERQVAALSSATTPELAAGLARLVRDQPLLEGAFVLGAQGERLIPATQREPAAGEPWPRGAAALLGGALGAALPSDPGALITRALGERDRASARALLEQAVALAAGRTRRTALFELGQLQERLELSPPLAFELAPTSAIPTYEELARDPIQATDREGRLVAALGRLRLALLLKPQRPARSREVLSRMLDELEASALLLPVDQVEQLASRAAALLDDPAAQAAARALGERRRRAEARVVRLEGGFGQVLGVIAREGALPRISAPRLEGASTTGLSYVKARMGDAVQVLTYYAQRPSGRLVVLQWDADALRRDFSAQLSNAPSWQAELAEWREGQESSSEVGRARLSAPFDHLAVAVSSREPDGGALDQLAPGLGQDNLQVWAIGLALLGIVMGAYLTTRAVQKESKEAQLKSDFVSNVTHELKTPLTSIRMFIETLLLGRVEDEEEARECLTVMERETRRLTRLIEQLLVFSRIESRKWRVRFSSEDPRELVREAIKVLADQLHTTPEELGIEVVAVQDLPRVAVDHFAFVEALLNLLHNAWKYSPNPDRTVRVVITQRRRELEIAVEDNGMGVPWGDRRRIFVKFERASNAEKSRVEGSGIGLTLAQEIVKGHGGKIRYTPLKPRGSRFSIFLPR